MGFEAKRTNAKVREDGSVLTGTCRLSFPHIFEKYEESGKYQAQLLIEKDDKQQLELIKSAIETAKQEGKTKVWNNKLPGGLLSPIHDGDDKDGDGYEGCYYLTAKSSRKIKVFDKSKEEIDDPDELYPGCYVRAIVAFYAYNQASKGVGCILKGIQKIGEGERLGGGGSNVSSDDWDDLPWGDEDDDFLS